MASKGPEDRNQEATVYMGNLDERCTDALIWELMLQAGPIGMFPAFVSSLRRILEPLVVSGERARRSKTFY